MDARLKAIASHIEPGVGFIDVGTDHGYLPAYLAKRGYTGNIIASDINPIPLSSAVDTAKSSGFGERIEFLLCDGLRLCRPEAVDCIVIAGMGGDMICHILDEAEWCMDARFKLILQPMTKAEVLRYWLVNNGFEILCEDADDEAVYQIIIARFGGITELTDGELFTGKAELTRSKGLYLHRLSKLCRRFERALAGMDGVKRCGARAELYRELLSELHERMNEHDCCE